MKLSIWKCVFYSALLVLVMALFSACPLIQKIFGTEEEQDTKAPTIISVFPINLSASVPPDSEITIVFNESMNPAATQSAFSINPSVTGVFSWTGDGKEMTFAPNSDLSLETTYAITLSAQACDLAGNNLPLPYDWSFTTEEAPVVEKPRVTAINPRNDSDTIATAANILITFSEEMDIDSVEGAFALAAGANLVTGTYYWAGKTLFFSPGSNLNFNTEYTITIGTGAMDLDGYHLPAFTSTFITAAEPDTAAPSVVAVTPSNASSDVPVSSDITVTFSEQMDTASVESAFSFSDSSGDIAGSFYWAGNSIHYDIDSELDYNTVYRIEIATSALDVSANALSETFISTFTTSGEADTTPPVILSIEPEDASSGVVVTSPVSITFSEQMDKLSVQNAFMCSTGGTAIPGTFEWNGFTCAFTPFSSFGFGTTYSISISSDAADTSGNSLSTAFESSFSTAEALDNTSPSISSTTPSADSTDVSEDAVISVTFSEQMDKPSVQNAFTLSYGEDPVTPVSGVFSWGGNTLTFIQSDKLNFETEYTITIGTGAADTSGNQLPSEFMASFTTIASLGQVATPVFSPETGTYETAQTVSITCSTPNSVIMYSDEGTALGETYIPYTEPIIVDTHTSIIVYATAPGYENSNYNGACYAIIPAGSTNLIGNGDFTLGAALWWLWPNTGEGADAETIIENTGHATTYITAPGTESWHVNFNYGSKVLLETGRIYSLSFDAYASTSRGMYVKFGEAGRDLNSNGNDYDAYLWYYCNLTTSTQTYSVEFGMINPEDDWPEFSFYMGDQYGDVTIDNVVVEARDPAAIDAASIPDANLRQAIADSAGVDIGVLNETHLLGLTELWTTTATISDLTGIDLCSNLEFAELDNHNISDITPLVSIKSLINVQLWNNEISDISALTSLPLLESISLQGNPLDLSDISIFTPANFPNLHTLHIDNEAGLISDLDAVITLFNQLENMSGYGIGNFNMNDAQFADLYNGAISDNINDIWDIHIWSNNLTDTTLALIGNILSVNWLNLDYNSFSDLSLLNGLTNLQYLKIRENNITDLQPLRDLYDAGAFHEVWGGINVEDNSLDLSPGTENRNVVDYLIAQGVSIDWEDGNILEPPVLLSSLTFADPNLEACVSETGATYVHEVDELECDEAGISDLSGIENLTYIQMLNLRDNSITTLSPISNLSNLEKFLLRENQINFSELSVLTDDNFPNLRELFIEEGGDLGSNIEGVISVFEGLPNLLTIGIEDFGLSDTQFEDLYDSAIQRNMDDFYGLTIAGNNVTNTSLALISTLSNLDWLNLDGNPITDISSLSDLSNLKDININKTGITDLQPLQDLYDAGAFREDWSEISIEECGLDLTPGTDNRAVVDYLIDQGVEVNWEEGNITNTADIGFTPDELAFDYYGQDGDLYNTDVYIFSGTVGVEEWAAQNTGIIDILIFEMADYTEGAGINEGTYEFDEEALGPLGRFYGVILANNLNLDAGSCDYVAANAAWAGENGVTEFVAVTAATVIVSVDGDTHTFEYTIHLEDGSMIEGSYSDVPIVIDSSSGEGDPVTTDDIPDANLRTVLEEETGKSFDEITTGDLEAIENLNVDERGVSDITGLELCTGLEQIDLQGNSITDFSPLFNLPNLRDLTIGDSPSIDFTGFTDMSGLERLTMDDMPINENDIGIFNTSNFPNLQYLGIWAGDSSFSSVAAVVDILDDDPNLYNYGLAEFGMTDAEFQYVYDTLIAPRLGTNLADFTELRLSENSLSSAVLTSIGNMTAVEILQISDNVLDDISGLAPLTNLVQLDLHGSDSAGWDLTVLQDLYDSGAFHDPQYMGYIDISENGMDLTTGTDNRNVVDYLIEEEVYVEWETGNTTN